MDKSGIRSLRRVLSRDLDPIRRENAHDIRSSVMLGGMRRRAI